MNLIFNKIATVIYSCKNDNQLRSAKNAIEHNNDISLSDKEELRDMALIVGVRNIAIGGGIDMTGKFIHDKISYVLKTKIAE